MAVRQYDSMTDEQLRALAQQNSAAWHGADYDTQMALHRENERINALLDTRNNTVTTFDETTGRWSTGAGKGASQGAKGGFAYAAAPGYASQYQGQIDTVSQQLLGRAPFTYDPESDPAYQQYRDSYTRSGQRAMRDTLGQVSARTGGLASSYAGSAAQQTYDGYMSALADKVPELRQLAYQMYMDEGNTLRANLSMLQGLESSDYSRYLDRLGQYNTDRAFAYGQYQDGVAAQQYADERSYQLSRDALADARYDDETAYARDQAARKLAAGSAGGGKSAGTSGGGKGGGSSAGTTAGWDAVERWVDRYGEGAAENYIREHYKSLGYSSVSAALAGWQNYLLSQKAENVSQSPAVLGILNHPNPNPGYVKDQVERGMAAGSITPVEADYILRAIGY